MLKMIVYRNLVRCIISSQKASLRISLVGQQSGFSSEHISSSDSDDDKKPAKKASPAKKGSTQRLNDLLNSMKTDSHSLASSLDITPVKLREKRSQMQEESRKAKEAKSDTNIEKVAQSVAKVLGGDIKQTESELLMKLLDIKSPGRPTSTSGEPGNLNNVLVGMKIEKEQKREKDPQTRAETVKDLLNKQSQSSLNRSQGRPRERIRDTPFVRKPRKPDTFSSVDLFGGEPLNIFDAKELPLNTKQDTLELWPQLQARELKLAVTQPPKNHFEKMILWTEQGKLWKFPINNEQGWEEEEGKVSFADHVFLETHLEGWCPQSGPIRHFMELVCVGLSKNCYLSVREKQEHIVWFRDYFETKKDLLKEIIIQADESIKLGAPPSPA